MFEDRYRYVLCKTSGEPLQVISELVTARSLRPRLNLPMGVSGQVPSGDRRIAGKAYDGLPYLSASNRVLKIFRQEGSLWRPRFCGTVWQVNDNGAEHGATTTFSAFCPYARLEIRLCLNAASSPLLVIFGSDPSQVAIPADAAITDGAQILKTLVDRTNSVRGPTGLSTSAGLGAVFEDVPDRKARWEWKTVLSAARDLTHAFNGFDVRLEYVDRTDGVLAVLSCLGKRGVQLDHVQIGWGAPPNNARDMTRLEDGAKLVNFLWGLGGSNNGGAPAVSLAQSAPSQLRYGVYEAASQYSDITFPTFVADLTQEELNFRQLPRELIETVPLAGEPFPMLWDDFDLGDSVWVAAGEGFRGGFEGVQRVYGADVEVQDGVERISKLYTAQEA